MTAPNNFKEKTLKEITMWAWAAAVLPITALAGLFFVWAFGTTKWWNVAMIIGGTLMFLIAVAWWWWALYSIKALVSHWDDTRQNVSVVVLDVREIKTIIREIFPHFSAK